MRRSDWAFLGLGGALLAAAALPVLAQSGGPESLLPPGFGEPETERPAPPGDSTRPANPVLPQPGLPTTLLPAAEADQSNAMALTGNAAGEDTAATYDLPPQSRRPLDRIGPLGADNGGVAPEAFGSADGRFLNGLIRTTRAPIVSRWASIVLRRVLLSAMPTPGDVNGADLAAERAALLLRMGEADAARLMVQSVDIDDYTPRLYDVAYQTYLAAADPAGLCPLVPGAVAARGNDPHWQLVQAICASFSGDQANASSLLNQSLRRGRLTGIDYRLAEKTVGAGPSSRRSVKIEWDPVGDLNLWRFGLATATNVEIPARLFGTVGDPFRAWEARAPMLSPGRRLAGVAVAARLGVLSGQALRDYYAQFDGADPVPGVPADLINNFRAAYVGGTLGDRVSAMRAFWSVAPADGWAAGPGSVSYAALPALARAAAALPPTAEAGADTPWLLAAMFAGGYDRNAANWVRAVDTLQGDGKARAWALLAVGLPSGSVSDMGAGLQAFAAADQTGNRIASHMLVAALVGLGRMTPDDVRAVDESLVPRAVAARRWAAALQQAAARGDKGLVVLIAAAGLQTRQWNALPPEHLAAILAAYRRVGLDPEARMIAAEAISRL